MSLHAFPTSRKFPCVHSLRLFATIMYLASTTANGAGGGGGIIMPCMAVVSRPHTLAPEKIRDWASRNFVCGVYSISCVGKSRLLWLRGYCANRIKSCTWECRTCLPLSVFFHHHCFTFQLNSQEVSPWAAVWASRGHGCLPLSPPGTCIHFRRP